MGEGKEGFDIKKFFDFSPLAFGKVGGIALKVGVIIIAIIIIKVVINFIAGDRASLYNQPSIEARAGSKVEYNVTQETDRSGWTTGLNSGGIKFPDNDKWGYYVGGQIAYEW